MKRLAAIVVIAGCSTPLFISGYSANGSVREPSSAPASVSTRPGSAPTGISHSQFARFRPVEKQYNWDDAERILSEKTLNEQVFDKDMSSRMRAQYDGTVAPIERDALRPARWASTWEVERYEQSRKDLANWTMKEVGKDQLKDFLRRSRKNSAAIDLIAGNTGQEESAPAAAAKPLTEKEKLAAAAAAVYTPREEPTVPTKLRAKLNVLKAHGQFTFMNPIVSTTVEARAGSGENLAVELNRDFRSLELNSRLRYGVNDSMFTVNVNKQITKEVSLDLNSQRWTGGKTSVAGEKKKETGKLLYSVSF